MRLSLTDSPPRWWLTAVTAVYLVVLFPSPEYPPYNADDGAWFLSLAINLAEHGRYSTDTLMLPEYGHHATWPPVFPGLMAALVAMVGVNWIAIKLIMAAFGLLILYLLAQYWRCNAIGQWATLTLAVSPLWFLYSHHPMTEVVYLAAIVATLIAVKHTNSSQTGLLSGLLATLAFYIRGYAVTLLPATVFYLLLKNTWPLKRRITIILAFSLPMLVGITAWWAYTPWVIAHCPLDSITAKFGNGAGILQSLQRPPAEYAQRLWWHDLRYPVHLMFPLAGLKQVLASDLLALISAGILTLSALGWYLALREEKDILSFWLPIGLGFLIVFGGRAARYWLTFLPFLTYYFLLATRRLNNVHFSSHSIAIYLVVGVNLIALCLHFTEPDHLRFRDYSLKSFRDLAQLARELLPKDALVVTQAPNRFYAVAQREALLPEHYVVMDPAVLSRRPVYVICTADVQSHSVLSALCTKSGGNNHGPLLQKDGIEIYKLGTKPGLIAKEVTSR